MTQSISKKLEYLYTGKVVTFCLQSPIYAAETIQNSSCLSLKSLDLISSSIFKKIFVIKSYDVVNECIFQLLGVRRYIYQIKTKCLTTLQHSENTIC